MSEEKRNGAMRIFEALSGVDQELLERSEESGAQEKIRMFPKWRTLGMLTAVLCFVVVGAAALGLNTLLFSPMYSSGPPETCEGRQAADCLPENALAMQQDSVSNIEGERQDAGAGEEAGIQEKSADVASGSQQNTDKSVLNTQQVDSDTAQVQSGGMQNRNISEEEARELELLGAYVPEAIPNGYGFEAARTGSMEEQKNLFISWTRGMDYIELSIQTASPDEIVFTDIQKPESYDVGLYEVPYADTVPMEYRETFDNPVFRSSELSLDLINARMKKYEDAGDTSTPRGNFAVYYEKDGVLVIFKGRGDAESIWKLFESIQP